MIFQDMAEGQGCNLAELSVQRFGNNFTGMPAPFASGLFCVNYYIMFLMRTPGASASLPSHQLFCII